jgi:hypothetical protein
MDRKLPSKEKQMRQYGPALKDHTLKSSPSCLVL